MKRVLAMVLAMSASLALFSGCGGAGGKQPSAEEVVKAVSAGMEFKDTMTMVAPDRIVNFYRIDAEKVDSLAVYMSGSGATAEEVAVIRMKDAADVGLAHEAMSERVENQRQSFENYLPAELEKLDKAVIYSTGSYTILAVADDVSDVQKNFGAQLG